MPKNILFTFCTHSMEAFKINFYATLQGDYEIVHEYIDVLIENQSGGGKAIWDYKISKILSFVEANLDKDILIYIFDLDIQFFADISKYVDEFFAAYTLDMAFQAENVFHGANIGICVMKANRKVKKFWTDVYHRVKLTKEWDQKIVNEFIWRNAIENYKEKDLKIGILPKEMYACSTSQLSYKALLHHANCTSDFNEKWNQFVFARNILGKNTFRTEEAMKMFLAVEEMYFTPLAAKFYKPEFCHLNEKTISINNYGSYDIFCDDTHILLIKNDSVFMVIDYVATDTYHKKTLFMGFFAEIGKHNGTYTRCYFVSNNAVQTYVKSLLNRENLASMTGRAIMLVAFPEKNPDFLLDNFTENIKRQTIYYKNFFSPHCNEKYRIALEPFGDATDENAAKTFQKIDETVYTTIYNSTWAKEQFSLTTSMYSPAMLCAFASNFYLCAFFTHRSLLVPLESSAGAEVLYRGFLANSHPSAAMRALQHFCRGTTLTPAQRTLAAHLAYWYSVFKNFEVIEAEGSQQSIPIISFSDFVVGDVKEIYEILKILFACISIDNKSLLIFAEKLLQIRPTLHVLSQQKEKYLTLQIEDFYQDMLTQTVIPNDRTFLTSKFYEFLR